jgi:hypothetical protein
MASAYISKRIILTNLADKWFLRKLLIYRPSRNESFSAQAQFFVGLV